MLSHVWAELGHNLLKLQQRHDAQKCESQMRQGLSCLGQKSI